MNSMPWPATHILIAEKFYPQHFSHLNRRDFILGNCFPDIRYPAMIDRKRTHIKNIPLSTIKTSPPFRAGLLFHTMVDGLWNAHVDHHRLRLFAEIPHNQPMIHTAKILQDKFLYSKSEGWKEIAGFFDTILPEEQTYGASDWMVKRWHKMLAKYLFKPPNAKDLKMLSISLPEDVLKEISAYYQEYQTNPVLTEIMVDFYNRVETLLIED